MIKTEIDTRGFKEVCDELAKISGKTFSQVVKVQAGLILKRMVKVTPAADVAKIRKRSRQIANLERGYIKNKDGTEVILSGSRNPTVKFFKEASGTGGKKSFAVNDPKRRWSDARWARWKSTESRLMAALAGTEKKIMKARGLAKQAWFNIAKDLGVEDIVKAPAYAKRAKARTKKVYENSYGKETVQPELYFVTLTQRYKYLLMTKFVNELQYSVTSRLTAFKKELGRGLFEDVKRRASRYPGLFLKP